ncbi:MAG: aldo/keto reductase [Dehalococcoidia bacterium]|nr:aldo/keto reductase [Dehalococcoidia bacterium]
MQTRTLGKTDISVSNLCLGTMQFGWTTDEQSAFAVLDAFVAAGGNFIDTADIYSRWSPGNPGGVAEEIIGRWMNQRGNRDSLIIATKVRGKMWEGRDGEGLGRAHIERAISDSLRRLQVDHIDLYQCHYPDGETPIEETLTVFGELIRAGKVRAIGASNYDADQLSRALDVSMQRSLPAFETLQPHHNLVHRSEYEAELARVCEDQLIGVIPYSPLAGGFLTGKYHRDAPLPESQRAGRAKEYMTDQGFGVIDALRRIAGDRGTSIPAVALAWQLGKPAVTAPIVGANTVQQLADLLPAAELDLTLTEMSALDNASASF